ncbi:MAG: TIGR03620 family F420-dependent LLM class oxidoreductase [Solirubrobacteraceae bacterium]
MNLSGFGVWFGRSVPGADHAKTARLAEDLGFCAVWLGGSPRLGQLRPMLEATQSIVLATGIVNIWQYGPRALAREFTELDRDFPDRTLLGLGIGHPESTSEYQAPLAKTRVFLDGLAAASPPVPRGRMVLAALGPKMLDLSFERTLGTHPYFSPVEHTRFARERLGSAAMVAPELAVVIDENQERGRTRAREYARTYLRLSNYTANLRRLGWSEADLAGEGSDELIDAVVPQGSAASVAAVARAHAAAGADHVCLQAVGVKGVPEAEWTALAAALGL